MFTPEFLSKIKDKIVGVNYDHKITHISKFSNIKHYECKGGLDISMSLTKQLLKMKKDANFTLKCGLMKITELLELKIDFPTINIKPETIIIIDVFNLLDAQTSLACFFDLKKKLDESKAGDIGN